jgi:hypothetical protein
LSCPASDPIRNQPLGITTRAGSRIEGIEVETIAKSLAQASHPMSASVVLGEMLAAAVSPFALQDAMHEP